MELKDKAVLITGSKRIGAVVATELARLGTDIALTCHTSVQETTSTADNIQSLGRRAVVILSLIHI